MSRRRLEGVNKTMLTLASLAYIARLLVRYRKRKPFKPHDFFCGAAFISVVAIYIMYIKETVRCIVQKGYRGVKVLYMRESVRMSC
jgi:hypothetical protein